MPVRRTGSRPERNPTAWALHALIHPGTLVCIAVLAINDHVLKAQWPGWASGKLSDIAGLAFFPLLVAALLGLARRSPRWTIVSSLFVTGAWFAAMKTMGPVADATALLVEMLSGRPAHIVHDPADLVALPAMGWALAVWRPPPPGATTRRGTRIALLVVAAFLSLATSSYCPERGPRNLAVDDGVVVADMQPRLRSADAGRTWQRVDEAADGTDWLHDRVRRRACFAGDPAHCFSIGGMQVLESTDAGRSWEAAWSYPEGRHRFVSRGVFGCGPYTVDAADVVVLDQPEPVVLAAMSDHGIVRRDADGQWTTPDLGLETVGLPTSQLGRNIAPELIVAVVGSYVFYTVTSYIAWSRVRRRGDAPDQRRGRDGNAVRFIRAFGVVAGIGIIVAVGAREVHPDGTSDPVPAVLLVPAVVVAAIPCMASLASFAGRWWQVTLGHPDPHAIGRLHRRTAWSALTFGALATVAAVAWSAGAIATLAAAYGAIALSGLVAVLVWWAATYQAFVRLDAHGDAAAHATPGTSPPNRADAGDGPA